MSSNLWIPKHLKPAVTRTKVVYYRYQRPDGTYRIEVGAPEEFPAPKSAEKIVCESAADIKKYSDIMRAQDQADSEMTEAQRYEIEEPIWKKLRAEMVDNLAKARAMNSLPNILFCEGALEKMDAAYEKRKEVRESYMHIEAFEQGK